MSLLRGEEIGVSGGDIEYKKKKKKKRRKRREIPNHHHPYRWNHLQVSFETSQPTTHPQFSTKRHIFLLFFFSPKHLLITSKKPPEQSEQPKTIWKSLEKLLPENRASSGLHLQPPPNSGFLSPLGASLSPHLILTISIIWKSLETSIWASPVQVPLRKMTGEPCKLIFSHHRPPFSSISPPLTWRGGEERSSPHGAVFRHRRRLVGAQCSSSQLWEQIWGDLGTFTRSWGLHWKAGFTLFPVVCHNPIYETSRSLKNECQDASPTWVT